MVPKNVPRSLIYLGQVEWAWSPMHNRSSHVDGWGVLDGVIMQSVTMDVISIRARKTKHRIIYCIVDEYQEDYKLSQKTSTEPLTLRQIISIFDNAQEDGGLINHARGVVMVQRRCMILYVRTHVMWTTSPH